MIEVPTATLQRAIGILRSSPMTATEFARRMWPERSRDRTPGQQSQSGHALLRDLARAGYVQRVGDLWMLRGVGSGDSAVQTGPGSAIGQPDVLPLAPVVDSPDGMEDAVPVGAPRGWADKPAQIQRLRRLVGLATEAVASVTHDAALGDLEIRGIPLDAPLEQACSWVVLRGRSTNVYRVGEDAEMIVALSPGEAARALYVRWQQSGCPPALLDEDLWLFADDGLIERPYCWKPADVDEEMWFCNMEPLDQQIQRQRAAAGLA